MLHERALLRRLLYGSDAVKGLRDIAGVRLAVDMSDLTQRDLIVPIVFDRLSCEQASRAYEKKGVVVHERTYASLYSARQINSIGQSGIVRVSLKTYPQPQKTTVEDGTSTPEFQYSPHRRLRQWCPHP